MWWSVTRRLRSEERYHAPSYPSHLRVLAAENAISAGASLCVRGPDVDARGALNGAGEVGERTEEMLAAKWDEWDDVSAEGICGRQSCR